jgi:hypothetical protein
VLDEAVVPIVGRHQVEQNHGRAVYLDEINQASSARA